MYTTPLLERFSGTAGVLHNVASLGKYMKIEARKNPLGWGCASRGASLRAVRARVFDDRFFKKGLPRVRKWDRKNLVDPFGSKKLPREAHREAV